MSTGQVTTKLLQSVPRWNPKVVEGPGSVEDEQLAVRFPVDCVPELGGPLAMPDSRGVPVAKRQQHIS